MLTVSYICILFSLRSCLAVIFIPIAGLLYSEERWWQEDLSSVKWLAMWNGSVPADPLERHICRADRFARRPWRLISYDLRPLRRPVKNGLPCSSGLTEVGCYLEEPDLVRRRWVPVSLPAYSSLALKWHMPVKQQCICTATRKRIRRSSHP